MTFQERVDEWIGSRRDILLDCLRIWLGVGLVVKGIQFVMDKEFITDLLLQGGELQFGATAIAHYIVLAHIGGGAMLALGLLTRIAVLFQIPPLLGAALLYFKEEGLVTRGQNFEFVALVLVVLILLAFHGAGRLSLDHYVREHQLKDEV